jgi:predicted kinase
MKQGILCIFSGPPLSGKSTFIGGLRKTLKQLVIISPDEIRFELTKQYQFRPELEHQVWQTAYQRIDDHLKHGDIVCLDATLINSDYRGVVVQRFPHYPIIYFAFAKPDLQLILERNARRKWKQIEPAVLQKMYNDYQTPTPSEKTYYFKVFDVDYDQFSSTISLGAKFIEDLYG